MNRKIIIGAFVGLLLVFILIFIFVNSSTRQKTNNLTESPPPKTFGEKKFEYLCESGKTAFELLQHTTQNVEFQGSSFGRFVTSINGVKQGNGKYWLYFIDSKDATISADAYICQGDEKIKWELK